MKIVTVVGARPQFVKAAVISREIAKRIDVQEEIVHTGQHFDRNMSDVFFEEMDIPRPHHNLDIHSLDHGAMTGRMLEQIEDILRKERPRYVLVYGDTNSTLAGALAARKMHIDVVHVEAGLRSFNLEMAEEVNRVLTDRISSLLCCPTDNAVANLRREGFEAFDCTVMMSGDVMYDAALYYSRVAGTRSGIIERMALSNTDFALCTLHRAENTNDAGRLRSIIDALNAVSDDMRVVLPLHPRTRKALEAANLGLAFETIDPVSYFDMLELLKGCRLVLTDSGGLQKEAFFFAKPCVTLRDETEWVELRDAGVNMIAGASTQRIVAAVHEMSGRRLKFDAPLYGDGRAAAKIVDAMLEHARGE